MTIDEKYDKLNNILKETGELVIAYSGGVDSTLLLKTAYDVLGENVTAIHAVSPVYPTREYNNALEFASQIGITLELINAEDILDIEQFVENPVNRCYICKSNILRKIREIAEKRGISHIADGSNADDSGDFRPGVRALEEYKIQSPLKEAGLTKKEIRELSKRLGLPTWEKPAIACLATRFPYGTRIERKNLKIVDEVENILCEAGFINVRARHLGDTVKIEVPPDEMDKFFDRSLRDKIVEKIKKTGYTYITLDLEGYRQGSMNEVLSAADKDSG